MSTVQEPNPPTRKEGDFPNTNTIPSGWVMDELTAAYNPGMVKPHSNGKSAPTSPSNNGAETSSPAADDDERFSRRLDPYPTPGDEFGAWL